MITGLFSRLASASWAREHVLLHVARGKVVVVVQADFSQRHGLGMRHPGFDLGLDGVVILNRVVRVRARGGVQERIGIRQGEGALGLRCRVPHHHGELHARALHILDHLGAVRIEPLVVDVRVRIEQNQFTEPPLRRADRPHGSRA